MDKSRITEATLYPDMAIITRVFEGDLTPESREIVFNGLPAGIIRDSARVSAKGEEGFKIEGIDIREEFLEVISDKEIAGLEEELEKTGDELHLLNSGLDFLNIKLNLLKSMHEISMARFLNEFYFKKTVAGELEKICGLYKKNSEMAAQDINVLLSRKEGLIKKIKRLKNDLSAKNSMRKKETVNCHVLINITRSGKYFFYLAYAMNNAQWTPEYDARLIPGENEVEISYYGRISQKCGERWDDALLYLSTARPSISAALPELKAWFIGITSKESGEFSIAASPSTPGPPLSLSEEAGAKAHDSGINVTFSIKERQDIPPDGTEKRLLISRKRFPVSLEYGSFPREIEAVYINGKFENSSQFPLLSGSVKVYHGGDYIGDSFLKTVITGERGELSLGIDDSIKIKRELLKKFTGQKGITKDCTRINLHYRIIIENFKKNPAKITLKENVPITQNREIKVIIKNPSGNITPDYRGVLNWELELKPGEKKSIDVEYSIEYPSDRTVIGMIL